MSEWKYDTIALELEHIAAQFCDKYCKWPEKWDVEKEGKELYESEICRDCPMSRLV